MSNDQTTVTRDEFEYMKLLFEVRGEIIQARDEMIADLLDRLARMTQERDGTHECNVRLFEDKARLIRQMTAMQAGH